MSSAFDILLYLLKNQAKKSECQHFRELVPLEDKEEGVKKCIVLLSQLSHYCQSVQSNQFSLSDLWGLSLWSQETPTKRSPQNVTSGWEGFDYCFSLKEAKASSASYNILSRGTVTSELSSWHKIS